MAVEYSLQVLKQQKQNLVDKKHSIETGDGNWLVLQPKREITNLFHQISDLQYAIEVLETHED